MMRILDPSRGMTSEDTEYWLAHPELQGMVAHFMAKGETCPAYCLAFASLPHGWDGIKVIRRHLKRKRGV